MSNPFIVFFLQSKVPDTAPSIKLPVAFGLENNQFDPTTSEQDARLIVLNDETDVIPTLTHTNKTDEDLPVIWHSKTTEKEQGLTQYGKPKHVAGFSHIPGNVIYDSMVAVLAGNSSVNDFVDRWRQALLLDDLDELAAIIQCLEMLTPQTQLSEVAYRRYTELLDRCPSGLREDVASCVNNGQRLGAVEKIQDYASDMLANQ